MLEAEGFSPWPYRCVAPLFRVRVRGSERRGFALHCIVLSNPVIEVYYSPIVMYVYIITYMYMQFR